MRAKIDGAGGAPLLEQKADAAALRALLERVAQSAARLSAIVGRALELEQRHGVPARPALPASSALSALPALPALPASPALPALAVPPMAEPWAVAPPVRPPVADDPWRRLTPRERQVLDLISDGLSSKEIARSLGITRATARCHTQNVLTKLGVGSRVHAAALVHRGAVGHPAASPRFSSLTRREAEVLRALASGLGQQEIAARLYLSPHTVRTHVQRLLAKLGVHSVLGALALVRKAGLPPPEAAVAPPA